jgi:hypothetical protein
MKLFTQAFIAIGLVLLLHGVILLTGSYEFLHTDTIMHALGGAAMGLLGLAIHQNVAGKYHAKHSPLWYRYTFVVGFAMLIGIAWEFHEYILDQTLNVWYNLPMSQLSLADTMKDFLMDWLGASIAFFLFHQSR